MHYFIAWLIIGALSSALLDREGVRYNWASFPVVLIIWPVLIYTTLFQGYCGNDREYIRDLMR